VNFAFPALVILAITLPGIFCRTAYKQRLTRFRAKVGDLTSEVVIGLFLSVVVHALTFGLFKCFLPDVSFSYILEIVAGSNSDQHYSDALHDFNQNIGTVFLYFLATIGIGYGLGLLAHKIVQGLHFDIIFHPTFHIHDKWFYVFMGTAVETSSLAKNTLSWWPWRWPDTAREIWSRYSELRGQFKTETPCIVSALVETSDKPLVYLGIIIDHVINSEGELVQITLVHAVRMTVPDGPFAFTNDIREYAKYYFETVPIQQSGYLILPYSKIINLHILLGLEVDLATGVPTQEEGVYIGDSNVPVPPLEKTAAAPAEAERKPESPQT